MARVKLSLILVLGISFSIAAQNKATLGEQTASHLAAAQEAEKHQDYQGASLQYEAILQEQPKLALIRQSLAVTYHLQNRYPEAISEFQKALRLDSSMWGSCLFLGMDYYKTNQFASAIGPLKNSIALNAKMAEPEARFWLAVTYAALGKPENALQELRRDLVLRPNNVDVFYYLTKTYDQAAATVFEQLGEVEPRSAAVALLQAERFLDDNRRDLAALQYRSALALRPDFGNWLRALSPEASDNRTVAIPAISAPDARANLELAALLADAGDKGQAAIILQALIVQKPVNAQAADVIAEAKAQLATSQRAPSIVRAEGGEDVLNGIELIREGRFYEAEGPLSRASKKNSQSSLQLLLIRSYVEAGDCEQVEDLLHRQLAKTPHNVDALLLLGRCYKHLAESTLQKLIQIDAESYGVHELLGKQHEEKTEYDAAIKEYQAALAKRPDLAGIHYAIGNVYRKMRQYDEAEKWLTEELARNPYHGLAHYRLGSIYTEQAKPKAAIPHLLLALQSHPQLIDAQLDLGRAYTANGEFKEAMEVLTYVSRVQPDNDRVHYLLSLAYSKQGRRTDAEMEMAAFQRLTRDRLERTQQDVKNLSDSLDR